MALGRGEGACGPCHGTRSLFPVLKGTPKLLNEARDSERREPRTTHKDNHCPPVFLSGAEINFPNKITIKKPPLKQSLSLIRIEFRAGDVT
jgi:hypothetical protein